jgi:hypothetical protein
MQKAAEKSAALCGLFAERLTNYSIYRFGRLSLAPEAVLQLHHPDKEAE